MKIELSDCTFIIPVMLESDDRKKNFEITLKYLTTHLDTNIIVFEYGRSKIGEVLLPTDSKGIDYRFFDVQNDIFHRTKCINEMLSIVKTGVTVNYDADVLLKPSAYKECYDKATISDLVYASPYGHFQYMVNCYGRDKIAETMSLDTLNSGDSITEAETFGHVQFFKTKSYIEGGMENEHFISYGAEDTERAYRFEKLGYKIERAGNYIYHLDHSRGINSNINNPYFHNNEMLLHHIQSLNVTQLREYYDSKKHINLDWKDVSKPVFKHTENVVSPTIWGGK